MAAKLKNSGLDEIKHTKSSKQVVRKRKRESTSSEHSGPTSPHEAGKRNKRATRACERCRNKKIKCDIERDIACNACVDANVVCEAGNGKHTEDKKYPPKYTESLETNNQVMVLVVDKLYRMLKNREEWTFAEPRMKDGGKGLVVIHDVAQALGCIRKASSLPDGFVEDAPALFNRLLHEEEELRVKQDIQTDPTTSTEEASGEPQSDIPKVESPGEMPSSFPGLFSNSSAHRPRVDTPMGSPHSSPPASEYTQSEGTDYFTLKRLPNRPDYSSQAFSPRSTSITMDQRSDSSTTSHEPSIESASTSQMPRANMSHMRMMNQSWNWPAAVFGSQISTAMDDQQASDSGTSQQSYYHQEQSPLSESFTKSPLSSSENSCEEELSSPSSPDAPIFQRDPFTFRPDEYSDATQWSYKKAAPSFPDSSSFWSHDSFPYDWGYNDAGGSIPTAEDEIYTQYLLNTCSS